MREFTKLLAIIIEKVSINVHFSILLQWINRVKDFFEDAGRADKENALKKNFFGHFYELRKLSAAW